MLICGGFTLGSRIMIYRGSAARRYGHRLHSADVRDDVRWLLEKLGATGRHHRPLVNRGNERGDRVVCDVFEIGPSADVPSRDLA
jgi:hypothetical protein